jgi:hypothetical protein
MKTVTIDLYKFSELSDNVQAKVLADYKETLEYCDDGVLEDINHLLEGLGFFDIDIEYSLDYSHVRFARVSGKFSKKDLTFVKNNYKGEQLFKIIEMLEPMIVCNYDVESETLGFFYDIMQVVNQMVRTIIENDYTNYYSRESLLENVLADDCDYLVDGTEFTFN